MRMLKQIEIRINQNCKVNKESPELQKAIYNGLENIAKIIFTYAEQGVAFSKVFNNDTLKYDQYKNGLFAYRHHDKSRTQLRLLYRVVETKGTCSIELVSFYVKRNDTKEYISYFTKLSEKYSTTNNYRVLKVLAS
jgi:hypothetical protein